MKPENRVRQPGGGGGRARLAHERTIAVLRQNYTSNSDRQGLGDHFGGRAAAMSVASGGRGGRRNKVENWARQQGRMRAHQPGVEDRDGQTEPIAEKRKKKEK